MMRVCLLPYSRLLKGSIGMILPLLGGMVQSSVPLAVAELTSLSPGHLAPISLPDTSSKYGGPCYLPLPSTGWCGPCTAPCVPPQGWGLCRSVKSHTWCCCVLPCCMCPVVLPCLTVSQQLPSSPGNLKRWWCYINELTRLLLWRMQAYSHCSSFPCLLSCSSQTAASSPELFHVLSLSLNIQMMMQCMG